MSSVRRPHGRLFQIRRPAAPKLLSPKLLCVRGTSHMLSEEDRIICVLCCICVCVYLASQPVAAKLLSYNRANRTVAVLCNHQRAVPKNFDKQMENLQSKVCVSLTSH